VMTFVFFAWVRSERRSDDAERAARAAVR